MKAVKRMMAWMMIFSLLCMGEMSFSFAGEVVEPAPSGVTVNTVPKTWESYRINENNYVKLRDLALVLQGDAKQFNVSWDAEKKQVVLTKNQAYAGSVSEGVGKGRVQIAQPVNVPIFVDGSQVWLSGYNIGENNYLKLRDMMQLLDISVGWDGNAQMAALDTSKPYVVPPKALPLAGLLICVDPGHGTYTGRVQEPVYPNATVLKRGYSTGTSGAQYSEAQVNLAVSLMLRDQLVAQGANVLLTREGAVAPTSNVGRAQLANKAGADMVIRVHCDGSTDKKRNGISLLVPSSKYVSAQVAQTSNTMGHCVLNSTLQATGAASGGVVVREDLSGFNWSTVPTILIEMGFMTNPAEDKKLSTWEYQQKLSQGITAGVLDYFQKNKSGTTVQKNVSVMGTRVEDYMKKNPGISQEEALWKIKVRMDQPEFTGAKMLTNEELHSMQVIVNKRYRVPDNYVPSDLVPLTGRVSLRAEAKTAFDNMALDAKNQGFRITPVSGFRTVAYQDGLYKRYLQKDSFARVETYSARPGYSEHHTGLAVDVAGSTGSMDQFGASKESGWVTQHAADYGFIVRYLPAASGITGYKSEPWHLRYVGVPVAQKIKAAGFQTLEEYMGREVL